MMDIGKKITLCRLIGRKIEMKKTDNDIMRFYLNNLKYGINKLGSEIRLLDFGWIQIPCWVSIIFLVFSLVAFFINKNWYLFFLFVGIIFIVAFIIVFSIHKTQATSIRDTSIRIRKEYITKMIYEYCKSPSDFSSSSYKNKKYILFDLDKIKKSKQQYLDDLIKENNKLKDEVHISNSDADYVIGKLKDEISDQADRFDFKINASMFVLMITMIAESFKNLSECITWFAINHKGESCKEIINKFFLRNYGLNEFWEHALNQGDDFIKALVSLIASMVAIAVIILAPRVIKYIEKNLCVDADYRIRNIEYAIEVFSEIKREREEKREANKSKRIVNRYLKMKKDLKTIMDSLQDIRNKCDVKDLINDQNILVSNANDSLSSIGNEVNEIKKKQRIRRQANIRKSKKT